jgi:putative tricarboxylic transport membrane protein
MAIGIGHRGLLGVAMRNRKMVFESIALMLLGIATIIGSLMLDNFGEKVLAPGLFPSFLGGILVFLAVLMLVRTLRKTSDGGDVDRAGEDHDTAADTKKILIRSGLLVAATVIYLLLLAYVGFIIATLVYVCVVMYLLGERRWWMLVLTPAAVTLLIFIVFEIGLKVYLP